ncbi:CHAD domain-containing protein [soil metagenome]
MAYRIDPGRPAGDEVRRALAEQLERAAEGLRVTGGPDAEAVHEARKRVKKARSLLRLARSDLGPAVARHANAELRQVGADLATQRDADALVEAIDRLRAATGDEPTKAALDEARSRFADRAERVRRSGSLDRATVLGAARVLEQLVSWIDLVPPKAEGWDALAAGLGRQYARGRLLLADLPDEPTAHELHEWRKRVKDLWYHQRLLKRLWTEGQRPVVLAADELASALGSDHDLGLLLAHLRVEGEEVDARGKGAAPLDDDAASDGDVEPIEHPVSLGRDTFVLVSAAARAERQRIQAEARRVGVRLYADEPDAWVDRHGAWWAAAAAEARVEDPADGTDPVPGHGGDGGHLPAPDPSPERVNA